MSIHNRPTLDPIPECLKRVLTKKLHQLFLDQFRSSQLHLRSQNFLEPPSCNHVLLSSLTPATCTVHSLSLPTHNPRLATLTQGSVATTAEKSDSMAVQICGSHLQFVGRVHHE